MSQQENEDAFYNARKLLRSFADASLDAIYLKDLNSRWLFANPALEKIVGKPSAELLGKTDSEIYANPEIGQAILKNDRKVMESGKPETFEEYVDLPDGYHFFISVKSPRFDEKGNVTGLLGISHDITNRKRREEQLRQSQQKYKALIETTSDFVWEMNCDGKFTYCSPQMEKLWGLKPEEMIGTTPFDQMPPEAKEKGAELFKEFTVLQKPLSGVQVPSLDSQGNLIFIELSGVPFFDNKGKLMGFRGITRDITERKKIEDSLRNTAENYRYLVKHAPTGIYEIDFNNGKFVHVNDAMCQYLGYTEQELLTDVSAFDVLTKQSQELFMKRIKRILAGEKTDDFVEYNGKTKDGKSFWTLLNVKLLFKEGKPKGALVVAQDITERKKAQKKLEEYRNNLEQLVEERTKQLKDSERLAAIGATAGMVGHDLKNPLQTIVGELYFANKDLLKLPESKEREKIRDSLREIETSVKYMDKIILDLRDYARPLKPECVITDLSDLVNSVLKMVTIPSNIVVKKDFENLSEASIDPLYVKRSLTNLVNNAVQAMPEGGNLEIKGYSKRDKIYITVSDTGLGISEEVKPKLFTPMVSTKAKGQGLGLAVVKRLIEALGGTITCESEFGKGTKFIIELPVLFLKGE